ncbi:MAG: DUF3293 domain-containing protein [Gammaproteobacteria bacterium]
MNERRDLPEDLHRLYENAVYEAELETGIVIFRVGHAPEGALPSGSFAILTACDPGRARPGDRANRVANKRLADEIERFGYAHRPANGRSEDGVHVEPSFAIPGIAEFAAVALAKRFNQTAVFYWDGAEACILYCG